MVVYYKKKTQMFFICLLNVVLISREKREQTGYFIRGFTTHEIYILANSLNVI